MIEKKIAQYIDNERLFPINARIIVALSGGADSVALLRILHTLGYDCEAAHCNFHLRGTESDRDEMFVRKLCKTMRTPLHTIDFATEQYAIETSKVR